jgi:hypothetical protein
MGEVPELVHEAVHAHTSDDVDVATLLGSVRARVHRGRRRRRGTVLVAATLVVVGAGLIWNRPWAFTQPAGHGVKRLAESTCPANGLCSAGFLLDGRPYNGSCGAVRPELVSEEVIARGVLAGRETEVRRIQGVDAKVMVALRAPGGLCDDQDTQALSPWSMAFPQTGKGDAETLRNLHQTECLVSPQKQRDRNRCGIGGPLASSPVNEAKAPLARYDPVDWPTALTTLKCEQGSTRLHGTPSTQPGADQPTTALWHLETTVIETLAAPRARAVSTVAFRQIRASTDLYEELFFRGDVWPVAYGTIKRAPTGRWVQGGYVACLPSGAAP